MRTTTTTTKRRTTRTWRVLQRAAYEIDLVVVRLKHPDGSIVQIKSADAPTISVLAAHRGDVAIMIGSRPRRRLRFSPAHEDSRDVAVDVAISEVARIAARRMQWRFD